MPVIKDMRDRLEVLESKDRNCSMPSRRWVQIALVIGAVVTAVAGNDAWGWMLLIVFLID